MNMNEHVEGAPSVALEKLKSIYEGKNCCVIKEHRTFLIDRPSTPTTEVLTL
jgi:hypothetical protein